MWIDIALVGIISSWGRVEIGMNSARTGMSPCSKKRAIQMPEFNAGNRNFASVPAVNAVAFADYILDSF